MEADQGEEIEVTDDLMKLIREKVAMEIQDQDRLEPDSEALRKLRLVLSLGEQREKQLEEVLRQCEAVVEYEASVKQLYSELGLEYRDTDSEAETVASGDDDDETMECDDTPQSPYEGVPAETEVSSSLSTNRPTTPSEDAPLDSETRDADEDQTPQRDEASSSQTQVKKAVVVLTRLPVRTSKKTRPTPLQPDSVDETDQSDSDPPWFPSTDSDCSYSDSAESQTSKKTGTRLKSRTPAKKGLKQQARIAHVAKEAAAPKVLPTAPGPSVVASLPQVPQVPRDSQLRPADLPPEDIIVNMSVLARRKPMSWQKGKICAIRTKEGKTKYKVQFEDGEEGKKSRRLVSGHHIAADKTPLVDRLYVGSRVVAKFREESWFCPAILGEKPNRRNKMRFLVFFDDNSPFYCALPYLRLVSRPLDDVCADIPESLHRTFIKDYLNAWPNPPLTQYVVAQNANAAYNGIQRSAVVKAIDCSLVQVEFQDDKHLEWIYRGSNRLEHIVGMKRQAAEMQDKDKDKGSRPTGKPSIPGK